jgi:hypothetical protein
LRFRRERIRLLAALQQNWHKASWNDRSAGRLLMDQRIESEQVYAMASRASMSLRESHNFETIFHIPATHRLVLVRSRSQGCPPSAIDWKHDEFASDGRLVARYRSFERISPTGERQSGWRKFDRIGELVSEEDGLR